MNAGAKQFIHSIALAKSGGWGLQCLPCRRQWIFIIHPAKCILRTGFADGGAQSTENIFCVGKIRGIEIFKTRQSFVSAWHVQEPSVRGGQPELLVRRLGLRAEYASRSRRPARKRQAGMQCVGSSCLVLSATPARFGLTKVPVC